MKSDKDIIAQWKKHKDLSKSRLSKQYANTKRCQSFYSGDFMSYSDTIQFATPLGKKKKAIVKFNKVKPYINAVVGFTIQNRRKAKFEARIESDKLQELFSGYANALDGYIRDNCDAEQIETQQDRDMYINGYGAVETALSYNEGYASIETDGEVIIGRLDPLTVGWDPFARATNLTDARYVYQCKEYDIDQATELFDDSKPEDFEENDSLGDTYDYEYLPNGGKYDKIAQVEWANKEEKLAKVYFYQWYDIEEFYKIPNPLYYIEDAQMVQVADLHMTMLAEEAETSFDPRAEILVVDEKTKRELEEYFGEMLEEAFEFKRKVFYTAVISGQKLFTKFKNISQQGFSIQFKTGDFDATNNIWTGLVNSMMEPALYYNKALTELMFTIAANSKGGVYIEEDAVEDISEFEDNYAKTDGVIVLNSGAISNNKIQDKARPLVATGLESVVSISDNAFSAVNGIDPSFLGSREFAQDTASFQRQRIKQVMSTLASYFDSIMLYGKRSARIRLDVIKVFVENNQGMTVRVIGEEGQAIFMRLSKKQLSAEFDVTIAEAPLTSEDREMQAQFLTAMGDKLIMVDPTAAKVIYSKAVELMPLDFSVKEQVRAVLNPEKGEIDPSYVAKLEEQLKTATSQINMATVNSITAKADLDIKRIEEIDANIKTKAANNAKILEEAKQTALENSLLEKQGVVEAKMSISV